ncbi:hypothetical protein FGG79_18940 [Bacillus sp. BHET2]|uniref:hypothetical protein n=1 Tax=Bacillus sp. BHET2 TaxID=2583818 RepID=UPI00110F24D4|nr:hypothetical protein [Bacillus sp. BHET2]TMU83774.1 hypothetical protein FGG79_18940 [Bacillus sp. BHET2]
MFTLIFVGVFWGLLLFTFTYTVSKKFGAYSIPPLINFLAAFIITAYGFVYIQRFEGMAYGFLGLGFLITAILGTISLRFLAGKDERKPLVKRDKLTLIAMPIIFITSLLILIYSSDNYWIIDEGSTKFVQSADHEYENYYRVTTISEGSKQVTLTLGEKYMGKDIDVEKVRQNDRTERTVHIGEGENPNETPYIMIGIDEIKEPLIVKTTEGITFESIVEKVKKK